MKQILLFTLVLFISFSAYSQNQKDVIILVDVSASIHQPLARDAKLVLSNLLVGRPLGNPIFRIDNDVQDILSSNPALIGNGNKILLMPFGDKNRCSQAYDFVSINNFPNGVYDYINREYPNDFNDQNTYFHLAIAKAAELASLKRINKYWLITITDEISDERNITGGKSANYNSYEKSLMDNYNNASNPVSDPKIAFIEVNNNNDYRFIIRDVELTNYKAPPTPQGTENVSEISILSFGNGKKGKEKVVKSKDITLKWAGAPANTKFKVSIIGYGGNKRKESETTTANSYSTQLSNGKYKITVSGKKQGYKIKSASTYIHVKSGSSAGIITFFIILILLAAGYFLWKRHQENKINKLKRESGYSPGSNQSTFDDNTEMF